MNIAVLVSGSGTNLQAILDAQTRGELGPGRVVLVVSNVPNAGALARAEAAGVPTRVLPHKSFPTREAFDEALVLVLREANVELVALAGFLRIVTKRVLDAFPGRVVNIHPSLLPAFPGIDSAKQALTYGVKVSGCTIHFVDEGTDTGPIIAQAAVPVLDDDGIVSLHERILAEEHRLYPRVLRAIAEDRIELCGRWVRMLPS